MLRTLLRRLRGGERAESDDGGTTTAGSEPDGAVDGDDASGDGSEGDTEEDPEDDQDDGHDVWDLIPSWQYDGRHVEAGGLTRGEQEQALEQIQRQAEAIEAHEGVDDAVEE